MLKRVQHDFMYNVVITLFQNLSVEKDKNEKTPHLRLLH